MYEESVDQCMGVATLLYGAPKTAKLGLITVNAE